MLQHLNLLQEARLFLNLQEQYPYLSFAKRHLHMLLFAVKDIQFHMVDLLFELGFLVFILFDNAAL